MPLPERLLDFEQQCRIELQLLEEVVRELELILTETYENNNTASFRDKAATANLAQSFYNGVENILKRVSKYFGVPLPIGDQ
jgi:hypothetical protein